ncbi:MAG: cobalamin-dependent protein, partial [Candidatus Sumerlaeota bacterium]|nr:cobalamin-dependent protein [Candidatus Sumerlaeota bacterium]
MRALLIYSRCPTTFWSFEKILELVGRKALAPPLSLATVAALLPADWEFRLVDRNVRPVREDEWEWAEIALVTGMIVQRADLHTVVGEARRRGKRVALGGPYATADPEGAAASGADYLVLDEGEITIPLFLDALKRGEGRGVFRSNGLR